MTATELKNAWPARSKKLTGMTTSSSPASRLKREMTGWPCAGPARSKCRVSCVIGKYGVAKSSCSRTICAPRPAASRTSPSAASRLAGTSQVQANWVAARVTSRVMRPPSSV